MEKEIITRWENGKENLRNWLKSHEQSEYDEYSKLVKILIKECLNYNVDADWDKLSECFEVSDHGEWQGTQIFLLHMDTYQPSINDYFVFHNYYGSCSGCDTLMGIAQYDYDKPTDEQVDEYMTLCLHMCQRMKCLGNVLND